jgi:hypothetical protein
MNPEFTNPNNSYFQNIKFTNDEIKYIGNFLVHHIEDKFISSEIIIFNLLPPILLRW